MPANRHFFCDLRSPQTWLVRASIRLQPCEAQDGLILLETLATYKRRALITGLVLSSNERDNIVGP